ncbi:MAG: hypothetical protein WKF90_13855 [Pyrinomonadaceae bacterium]
MTESCPESEYRGFHIVWMRKGANDPAPLQSFLYCSRRNYQKTVEVSLVFAEQLLKVAFRSAFVNVANRNGRAQFALAAVQLNRQNNASRSELSRFSTLNWRIAL